MTINTVEVVHQPLEISRVGQDKAINLDAEIIGEGVEHRFDAAQSIGGVEPLHAMTGDVNVQIARDRNQAGLGETRMDEN